MRIDDLLTSRVATRLVLAVVVAGFLATPAAADWTASGSFSYTDRLYNSSGWTGTQVLPIRRADIEIYDLNTLAVLSAGATDGSGAFSIFVPDASTRDVGVRVLASTDQSPAYNFRVADDANSFAVYSYHDATTDITNHNPNSNVNFGSMTAPAAIGDVSTTDWSSQVFNTFDLCVAMADWIAILDGPGAAPLLTTGWNPNNGRGGSSYSGGANRMNLADDDGYDDPNIIHELGHYIEDEYGRSRNTGGSHTVSDDDQDPRLAWSEGFATYVSSAILDEFDLPRPDMYSDRNSFGTSGGFSYTFEGGQTGGSTQERAVSAALHDLIDSAATNDGSPGTDDDPLVGRGADVWTVLAEMRVRQLPTTNMENFWDLWFELGLGSQPEMEGIFGSHQIDFFPDAQEDNSAPENATVIGNSYIENTFYRSGPDASGDEDWFVFSAVAGNHYDIEVNGAGNTIYGRPDPELFLIDLDTGRLLAYNHDPYDSILNTQSNSNAQQMSETAPRIYWEAPQTKNYYVLLRHSAAALNITRYGTYQIRAEEVSPLSPTLTAVACAPMRPGQSYPALLRGEDLIRSVAVSTDSPLVSVSEVRWIAPEAVFVTFDVAPGATPGSYDVTVTQPGGADTATDTIVVDSSAAPAVIISEVELGGVDRVELRNLGTIGADLTGWQVIGRSTSSTEQTYTFPNYTLPAGGRVVIHENSGTDTATDLFDQASAFGWPWGNGSTGDVSLLDAAGNNIDYQRFVLRFVHTHQAPLGNGALWMQPEVRSPPSGFTLSRAEDVVLPRVSRGLSAALPTMPQGSSARTNAVDRFEDNDNARRCAIPRVGTLNTDLRISPRPSGEDEDWFGIPIASGQAAAIRIAFSNAAGDLDMKLYAPGDEANPIASSESTNDEEAIVLSTFESQSFGGGLYKLRVYGFLGDINDYSLIVVTGTTGSDCNGNDVPDSIEIEAGVVADSDGDGTPDQCVPPEVFQRGDCNSDGTRNVADAIFLLNFLFLAGMPSTCEDACDVNDDAILDLGDAVTLLGFLFGGLGGLPEPLACGPDATPTDPFGCVGESGCP